MITLKTSGYTSEDFSFLRKSLMRAFAASITDCESQTCETCKAKRASDDLNRLLNYVIEK